VERPFTVVAIIAAHNEADVIEHVVRDLIDQGVLVYFIDDDSTDGTREIAEQYVGRGVLAVERFDGRPGVFEWERILERKAELASTLDADWFIHHDADEFRESPWLGMTLRDAIQQVDALGYNAIDFALMEFWPVHDDFEAGADVRAAHGHWATGEPFNRLQIRCWKKRAATVALTESGGHEAVFRDRDVFPIRFLLRHYPIRSQAQGRRKIGPERRARFLDTERERGWHVQYDAWDPEAGVLRSIESLTPYDPIATRRALFDEPGVALAEARRQLEEAVLRADEQSRAMDRLGSELHEHRRHVARLTEALARAEHRVDALQNSISWRCMAPARAAYRILTGREA
jgi:hypothetical protein